MKSGSYGSTLLLLSALACFLARGAGAQGPLQVAATGSPSPPRLVAAHAPTPRIEPPLREYMQSAAPGDLIPVVVIFSRQLTGSEKAAIFDSLPATSDRVVKKEGRRRALVAALRHVAAVTQPLVRDSLDAWAARKLVRGIRPLWLVNAIGMAATPAAILQLDNMPGIERIHLDLPRFVPSATPTWSVNEVGGDAVWSRTPTAYTGAGAVVGILDSGMDYDHKDLAGRVWINRAEDVDGDGKFRPDSGHDGDGKDGDPPASTGTERVYVDDVIGWNFAWASPADGVRNEPEDELGHGTRVAGIVAGDGSGGTATGVAPGASLMVLRCTSFGLTQEAAAWEGMQYALAKGADVVNFSSAFTSEDAPDSAAWRLEVENLSDGGVLFVTGSGNDANVYDDPLKIPTPGRVPLALTAGATRKGDLPWTESNYGPVTWTEVKSPEPPEACEAAYLDHDWPPGLLKPDVVAPGVDVTTTDRGGGYANDSGTSYAAPHVAGVAALLLEKDPGLTAYELKFILEETARDLGTEGKEDEYGWGRIDANAAIEYGMDRKPFDLAVTGTSALWSTVDIWVDNDDDGVEDTPSLSAENHLYARIRNLGGEAPANVEVKFYYADVATIGISGFDPNGDGDPCDGVFTYIGSDRIPTMGPAGSRHATAEAVVHWRVPDPGSSHWCVGIGIVGSNSANGNEENRSNNVAFRNFFELETSTAVFPFRIAPVLRGPREPFAVEILKRNLPASVRVELVVDARTARALLVDARGLEEIPRVQPALPPLPAPAAARRAIDRATRYRRFEVQGDRAVLRHVVAPKGEFLPARLVIRSSQKLPPAEDRYVIVNTLDPSGRPVGGFTLKLVDRK